MRLIYIYDKSATLKNKYDEELTLSKSTNFTANPYTYIVEDGFHIGKEKFEKLLQRCEVRDSKRDKYENLLQQLGHIASIISKEIGENAYLTDSLVDAENAVDDNDKPFSWEKGDRDENYTGWDSMYRCALDAAAYRVEELGKDINDYGIHW